MKILTSEQIRALDAVTIAKEPISSSDLMERASAAFCRWFKKQFPKGTGLLIFCGPGNNGGDGLCIARLLRNSGFSVRVFYIKSSKYSPDFQVNLNRWNANFNEKAVQISRENQFPKIKKSEILIDALFGSGLSRPIEGIAKKLIAHLNKQKAKAKIAVDIPSGLFANKAPSGAIIKSDFSISFEFPKLAFMFPENHPYVGEWNTVNIGLLPSEIKKQKTPFYYSQKTELSLLEKKPEKFAHKGKNGKGLLIAGKYGMAGGAILAGQGALDYGIGYLTCHLASKIVEPVQAALPKSLISTDPDSEYFTELSNYGNYDCIAVGPALGKEAATQKAFLKLLRKCKQKLIFDADALNIIAENKWQKHIPKNSILTPHLGEFARLFGSSPNSFERVEKLRENARLLKSYIILKGAHTAIAFPNGDVHFNSSGHPSLAQAGSGDRLTGILLALVCKGYSFENTCKLAVYYHGIEAE